MKPHLQRVEIEPVRRRNHDLAVHDAVVGQRREKGVVQVREVPVQRTQIAALDEQIVAAPEHNGAKPVPFRLVQESVSGRQLFGSASAWLFFEDGYRVLDALDDDRSGELRGAELAGIAVWFDRDIDGVSDRGEVVPVEALGIVALATEATERIGRSLGNPCGLELADGRILPTYDWVLSASEP